VAKCTTWGEGLFLFAWLMKNKMSLLVNFCYFQWDWILFCFKINSFYIGYVTFISKYLQEESGVKEAVSTLQ
jgi:hypothetical protein